MCGICGIIAKRPKVGFDIQKSCSAMGKQLTHRGPDQYGDYVNEYKTTAFAHRRLSILDLSQDGKQPMFSEDRSCVLIANGEIYNYRELQSELKAAGHIFSSASDSEVILHLFENDGAKAFSKLRGMYAVAIYNNHDNTVTLTRDPLGIKPIYIYETDKFIAFSSEIRAFNTLTSAPETSPAGISDFLFMGAIQAPNTHLKNVRALKPGEIAVIRDGHISFKSNTPISGFCIESSKQTTSVSSAAISLRDSVQRHLISDAPIGLFLSGGIDSGVLAGLARETTQADIRGICVTVPGHPMDESSYAQLTANRYNIDLTEIPFGQSDFENGLDHFFQHMDMPTIDGFNTYIVSRAARQAGLTVALSGVGGDELFGGYPTFGWVPNFQRAAAVTGILGSVSRNISASLLTVFNRSSGAARVSELLRHKVDRRIAHLAFRGLFVGSVLEDLLHHDLKPFAQQSFTRYMDETAWVTNKNIASDIAVAGMEISHYMQPTLLRDADVFSMAHSLEVRTPLVDTEVIKTCMPLLGQQHKTDGHPKWALRQALKKKLPSSVVSRQKQGFSFPWQEWMRGFALKDLNNILSDSSNWKQILDEKKVYHLINEYKAGRAHWRCFWAIYVLLRMLVKK